MITINHITQAAATVAGEFPIKRILLFGSYAENSQTERSDVDFMIEFEDSAVSLLTLSALKNRLQDLLSTEVDIIHIPLPKDALIEPGKVVEVYAA